MEAFWLISCIFAWLTMCGWMMYSYRIKELRHREYMSDLARNQLQRDFNAEHYAHHETKEKLRKAEKEILELRGQLSRATNDNLLVVRTLKQIGHALHDVGH